MGSADQVVEQIVDSAELLDFHKGFEALNQEFSYWIEEIDGEIPADLTGTFYRNGPGRMKVGDQTFGHWFDGDGMLSAVTFREGKAHYRNRYVRTPKYIAECQKGCITHRGLGTQRPGGILANLLRSPANPANTNVIWHGNKLLALYEGGRPFEIDPYSLETKQEYRYDDTLSVWNMFSAHGRIDPRSGIYYNFGAGCNFDKQGVYGYLDVYKISPGGHIVQQKQLRLPYFPFLHDFALTENYAVFFINSVVFDRLLSVALGLTTGAKEMRYDDKMPCRVLVLDLKTMELVEQTETDPALLVHFGNSYQDGDELIIDAMHFNDFAANDALLDVFNAEELVGAEYYRYHLNLKSGKLTHEIATDKIVEFPTWNTGYTGVRNRYTYGVANENNGTPGFFNAVYKFDRDSATVLKKDHGVGRFTSETLFLNKQGAQKEDDGYLASFVYDARKHKTDVVILDAKTLEERANLHLKHHVPFGFHGFFTTETFV